MPTLSEQTASYKPPPDAKAIRNRRLEALDAELQNIYAAKLHRAVRATLRGVPVTVHISRDRSGGGYYGSAQFGGKQHSCWGKLPSHCVVRIIEQLNWTFDRIIVDENFKGGTKK